MLELSKKALAMPSSPIRKLVPFAEKAKREGKTVYHLNIGQPDIKAPKQAIEALKNTDLELIAYSNSTGIQSFKQALVHYYKSVGIETSEDEIIVTTGGSEALLFGFLSCFNPGDNVIIPEPYYANYNGFATTAGIQIKTLSTTINDNFALPKAESFEKLIDKNTKGILICNPGNPTGTLYTKEELAVLAHLAKKHGLYLFADEVYREFCYDTEEHQSIMQFKEIDQHIVLIDSLSKRFSMCGSRVGVFLSKNKALINAATKFAQARLSPPTLAQIMGEAAFSAPKKYMNDIIQEYQERRNLLVELLSEIPGVKVARPKGAFYCIAQLPVSDTDVFCQWLLEEFSYDHQTVMLAPASGFYEDPTLGKTQVRIAYVLEKKALKSAMICLKKALEVYTK